MKTKNYKQLSRIPILISCLIFMNALLIQAADKKENSKLLDEFVKSQGYQTAIVFDASNIKQFWIDKSVISKDNLIYIQLNADNPMLFESIPLKIQLANINVTQQCKIDVISDDPALSFTISSDKSKDISISESKSEFIDYHIASRVFRIVSLLDNSFSLNFKTKTTSSASIYKIVLSFSRIDNLTDNFTSSMLTKDNLQLASCSFCDDEKIMIRGKRSRMSLKTKIPLEGKKEVLASVKVKNVGEQPTNVYVGYSISNKDGIALNGRNYPYNATNPILNVISAEQGSDTIVVDQYPVWGKNCFIALDPKEDNSDIPNVNLLSPKIANVTKESDGRATITLDAPLPQSLEKGTKIRIHGLSGSYIYTNTKILDPGEEFDFTSAMIQDDSFLQYSSKAFSRGVFYVTPIVLFYSQNAAEDNTILVSDLQFYSVSK